MGVVLAEEVKNRWDYAWKMFCNPKMPWGPWFLKKITGLDCEGYTLEAGTLEESTTEQQMYDGVVYADKFIVICADTETKIIHLEFQSTTATNMAWRMLQYGLNYANTATSTTKDCETYELPIGYIVAVRASAFSGSTQRTIKLKMHHQQATLTYPVVNVEEAIPEIGAIMKADGVSKIIEAAAELGKVCQGFVESSVADIFYRICSLISLQGSYKVTGSNEDEVEFIMEGIRQEQLDYDEFRRAEGREEVLSSIMKKMGWTREQALKELGLGKKDYSIPSLMELRPRK